MRQAIRRLRQIEGGYQMAHILTLSRNLFETELSRIWNRSK